MITTIQLENVRGISAGRLDDLMPLTILTGPNACGKSTVLDGLLIAASPTPEEAVGHAVSRHATVLGGAKWLFGDSASPARLSVETATGARWQRKLEWYGHCEEKLKRRLMEKGADSPFSMIQVSENSYSDDARSGWTAFGVRNEYEISSMGKGLSNVSSVRLVDPGLPMPLHRTFTEVARTGRREAVYELLSALVSPRRPDRLVLNLDSDAEDSSDQRAHDVIRGIVHEFGGEMGEARHGPFMVGHTQVFSLVWMCPNAEGTPGVPHKQMLERLVAASIQAAHPDRGPAVQRWLDAEPRAEVSPKSFTYSYLAKWYAESGADDFFRAIWRDQAIAAQLRERLEATGAWGVVAGLVDD